MYQMNVIYLPLFVYRVEELIVPVLMNQNLNESCIFLNENHTRWGLKNYYIRTSISFDWSLNCKLQLIDLITVFASFLVGRQTILVSFFSRERRNRKETNGWKNKSPRNWTLQIHLSRFVRKFVCLVSKNAIEEFNRWPCKHYNFQTCLRDNLVPRMLRRPP